MSLKLFKIFSLGSLVACSSFAIIGCADIQERYQKDKELYEARDLLTQNDSDELKKLISINFPSQEDTGLLPQKTNYTPEALWVLNAYQINGQMRQSEVTLNNKNFILELTDVNATPGKDYADFSFNIWSSDKQIKRSFDAKIDGFKQTPIKHQHYAKPKSDLDKMQDWSFAEQYNG
ncbi:hypothetical protein [Mycoplasma sp. Ms02]|uniref:hypothetical protein n=1 Tax=Mycoplasma sp. Ms02 TaxID=353851 RepID=UPI001C898E83|nr:hypothetical protein [Mycoplasma sp. Ms02]QZE12235.1 hypothetical protein K4L35_02770 [Mycoplasma sp. Ms02]